VRGPCHVGVVDRGAARASRSIVASGRGAKVREQARRVIERGKYRFGHPVVDERQERRAIFTRKRLAAARRHAVRDAALDARDRARPQLCAMSVALDAQAEIVPGRGITSSTSPVSACSLACGPYVRTRSSVGVLGPRSASARNRRNAEIGNDAEMRVPARFDSSLAMRNGDRAIAPAEAKEARPLMRRWK